MTKETVLVEGRFSAVAAAALEAGDVLYIDTDGKLAKTNGAKKYALVAFKAYASGAMAAAENRPGTKMYVKADGSGTAIAKGDLLETNSAGKLVKLASGTQVAVALAAASTDTKIDVMWL